MSRLVKAEEVTLIDKVKGIKDDLNSAIRDMTSKGYTVEIEERAIHKIGEYSPTPHIGVKITWQESIAHF